MPPQISTNGLQEAGRAVSAAAAAALLTLGAATGTALASEFDLRQEPTPTSRYVLDDAGVLSKATKKDLNERLKALEVPIVLEVALVFCRERHVG